MAFSISPKLAACISAIPTPVVGGISLVLYGMISAVGVRNVVENKIDFSKARNVIIAAIILVLSIGVTYSAVGSIKIPIGKKYVDQTVQYVEVEGEKYYLEAGDTVTLAYDTLAAAPATSEIKEETTQVVEPVLVISLSGLAVGSIVGIVLNAILPGKDYVFEDNTDAATSKNKTMEPGEPEKKNKSGKKK